MHGLINRAIQSFVCATYGRPCWQQAMQAAGLDFEEFEAMLIYDADVSSRVLDALCADLERPKTEFLEDLGTYLVSHPNMEGLRRLLRFGGVSYVEFLHSLDDLSDRVRLAVSDLVLPALELQEHSPAEYRLHCAPGLPGFSSVMTGVLRAMADDYGALVILTYEGQQSHAEVISIILIESAFSQGRHFDLGGATGMTSTDALTPLLETLCPMFVQIDDAGRIVRVGPTLQKLRPDSSMAGAYFLDIFELLRPRSVTSLTALIATHGTKLHLRFQDAPRTALKGLIAPLPGGGAIINLSFGISILDAVRDYALTSADFSGTDLAIELLYLVEAKSAAMEASRSLNLRLQGAKLAAEEQAYTDTLTGLRNRRAMDHLLGHLISMKASFALMHLDLDFFKSVNDRLGHAAGDYVLQQAAQIMLAETRGDDTVARVGGDEFVLIFKGMTDVDKLDRIACRLIARLCEPMQFEGAECQVSCSIGTALSTQFEAAKAVDILHAADLALYAAKRGGRSCHRFYCALSGAQQPS